MWIRVADWLPRSAVPVLAYYETVLGKGRTVRAMYAPPATLPASGDDDLATYDEEEDEFWCPEGWYETNEHEDTHWMIDEPVTHWMPLPDPPKSEAAAQWHLPMHVHPAT